MPYDITLKKHDELKKFLEEYKFLLSISSTALLHMLDGSYESFDALVGENGCHIRAIKTAILASKGLDHLYVLCEKIAIIQEKIDRVLEPTFLQQLKQKKIQPKILMDQYHLDIQLCDDAEYLIQAFLLKETKQSSESKKEMLSIMHREKSSPALVQVNYPYVSMNFIEKLIAKFRQKLSEKSVQFIAEISTMLNNNYLAEMTSEDFVIEHNKLKCVPAFFSMKAVFLLAAQTKIPIFVRAKFLGKTHDGYQIFEEDYVYYKVCPFSRSYVQIESLAYKSPICIVEGVICPRSDGTTITKKQWRNEMNRHTILDILFAIGASHRQYPNHQEIIQFDDLEYNRYMLMADQHGFSLNNPTTFFARHIYCSQRYP